MFDGGSALFSFHIKTIMMKKKVLSILLPLLVLLGMVQNASAQIYDADGLYVDTVFHDHINRQADDFVIVSLCVADPTTWQQDMLGTNGHAWLRLQCPVFDLDNCFSYESEDVNTQFNNFLSGKLKMGMFVYETGEYIKAYQRWNRAIHEYKLNLPPDAEQHLWEIMDNHNTASLSLHFDMDKYGCAISVVRFVKQALGEQHPIIYPENTPYHHMTHREIAYRDTKDYPWLRLATCMMASNDNDADRPIDEKLYIPADLAEVWCESTVDGHILAEYVGDLVDAPAIVPRKTWFTPELMAWILLLVTLGFACTKLVEWDWLMLIVQTLFGLLLLYLACFTQQFGGSGPLLMIVFTPLPLLLWKWRRYWQLPYAIVLLIGVIVVVCWPHMLVDPAFLIWALSYVVIFAKDPIKAWIASRWSKQK